MIEIRYLYLPRWASLLARASILDTCKKQRIQRIQVFISFPHIMGGMGMFGDMIIIAFCCLLPELCELLSVPLHCCTLWHWFGLCENPESYLGDGPSGDVASIGIYLFVVKEKRAKTYLLVVKVGVSGLEATHAVAVWGCWRWKYNLINASKTFERYNF